MAAFYAVEYRAGDDWKISRAFTRLVNARRWVKRFGPARIIRHLGAERREVS